MTDLALRDEHHHDMTIPTPASINDPTGGRLVAWAEGLAAAHRIGTALCQTSFVPQHFRCKAEEAAAAILYGDEIGFSPTQSLQNLYVISGKPALHARAMVALVQSRGHDVWTEESSPTKVVVCGRRSGRSHVERSEWTIAKARQAGYTSNKRYEQAPEDMLYARAAATVCRRIAADALTGIAYTVEELEMEAAPATRTVTRGAETQTIQRNKDRVVAPEPEPDFGQPAESVTDAQLDALHATFSGVGVADRDARLAYCRNLIGRDITSSKDLTKAEASLIIDVLRADALREHDAQP